MRWAISTWPSQVVEVSPGPVVTRYEVEPAPGVKVNRIASLSDDLARVMSAKGIRIQAPVPGKSVVGVEIANQERETVYLREILEDEVFQPGGFQAGHGDWARPFQVSRVPRIWPKCPIYWSPVPLGLARVCV